MSETNVHLLFLFISLGRVGWLKFSTLLLPLSTQGCVLAKENEELGVLCFIGNDCALQRGRDASDLLSRRNWGLTGTSREEMIERPVLLSWNKRMVVKGNNFLLWLQS